MILQFRDYKKLDNNAVSFRINDKKLKKSSNGIIVNVTRLNVVAPELKAKW